MFLYPPHRYHASSSKSKLALFIVFSCTGLLMVINVVMSSRLSNLGIKYHLAEQKAQKLQAANTNLRQALATSTALTDLQTQAEKMGYVTTVTYKYLLPSHVVAFKP